MMTRQMYLTETVGLGEKLRHALYGISSGIIRIYVSDAVLVFIALDCSCLLLTN